ncbi:hypothetical protein NMG60_11029986 [Bertholletia excelsa]
MVGRRRAGSVSLQTRSPEGSPATAEKLVHSKPKGCLYMPSLHLPEEGDLNEGSVLGRHSPNALRRRRDPTSPVGFSLGVDLGASRTGLALSKGFSIRPLTVLELRGQKLELRLLEIAERQEVDEFIVGLPKNAEGKETQQSNKIRSVAGRLAIRAAERGWRVYLQDEYGTTTEALSLMIDSGLSKFARQEKIDAYAAMMVLDRYFSFQARELSLYYPKQLELQEKLRFPPRDKDFLEEFDN